VYQLGLFATHSQNGYLNWVTFFNNTVGFNGLITSSNLNISNSRIILNKNIVNQSLIFASSFLVVENSFFSCNSIAGDTSQTPLGSIQFTLFNNTVDPKCPELCAPLHYRTFPLRECLTCPEDRYAPAANASSCALCPGGTLPNKFLYRCSGCNPGFYLNSTKCIGCPAGQYQPDSGKTTCIPCPVGGYSPSTGYSQCVVCDYDAYSLKGSTSCIQCSGIFERVAADHCYKDYTYLIVAIIVALVAITIAIIFFVRRSRRQKSSEEEPLVGR